MGLCHPLYPEGPSVVPSVSELVGPRPRQEEDDWGRPGPAGSILGGEARGASDPGVEASSPGRRGEAEAGSSPGRPAEHTGRHAGWRSHRGKYKGSMRPDPLLEHIGHGVVRHHAGGGVSHQVLARGRGHALHSNCRASFV